MRAALIASLLLLAAQPARASGDAPAPVISAGPSAVSVTVYRAPDRGEQPIDRSAPQGFALISETRTISLPAGPAVIRFEGVAGNIFPETAIITGLPGDVREKNLDADLLSPRTLYDRALGRRVIIRRTNPKTGKASEEQAVIRSSADGAAVLQVAGGNQALRCSGLPETIVYDSVPADLSAKPTLSIQTDSPVARTVTVTLSYLAGGFDWQADYVATMGGDKGKDSASADLFAWLTLASNDVTSFEHANLQVVAGRLNREQHSGFGDYQAGELDLQCWPDPDYATHQAEYAAALAPPPPPPPPAPMMARAEAMDVVVTGSKRLAALEQLGDLKLYRVPDPVTVAAKSEKQVAFLDNRGVQVTPLFVSDVRYGDADGPFLTLKTRNTPDAHLGIPLPAGQVAVFENASRRPILVGETHLDDKAVNEDVEVRLGASPAVNAELTELEDKGRTTRYRLVVTNANAWPIAYEARLRVDGGQRYASSGARLLKRDGKLVWAVTVPANGTAVLNFTQTDPRDD